MSALKLNDEIQESVEIPGQKCDGIIHDNFIEIGITEPIYGIPIDNPEDLKSQFVKHNNFRIPKKVIVDVYNQYIKPEVIMSGEEEVLRLKLTIIGMINYFYELVSPKRYKDYIESYGMTYDPGEYYYFHRFESAGEKAWSSLGFKNCIITGSELYSLGEELRNKLLEIDLEKKGVKKDEG